MVCWRERYVQDVIDLEKDPCDPQFAPGMISFAFFVQLCVDSGRSLFSFLCCSSPPSLCCARPLPRSFLASFLRQEASLRESRSLVERVKKPG